MMMVNRSSVLMRCLVVFAACAMLSSCERIKPVRTLPSWVRGIYVPMFKNATTEPGLEEVATRATQEEFLADGRVDIVRKADADLQLRAEIKEYRISVYQEGDDDIPEDNVIHMVTSVRLYDPFDDETPVADLGDIFTVYRYNSDPRSVSYDVEPDVKRRILRLLGRQIVAQTITGFPVALRGQGEDAPRPKTIQPASAGGDIFRRNRAFD